MKHIFIFAAVFAVSCPAFAQDKVPNKVKQPKAEALDKKPSTAQKATIDEMFKAGEKEAAKTPQNGACAPKPKETTPIS